MMIVHGITMQMIKAYEIVLEIDGQESCITLDDTFPPSVDGQVLAVWQS